MIGVTRRREVRWHQFVVACSVAAPLATLTLPSSSLARQGLGMLFVLLVPGMALVGRTQRAPDTGLGSPEMLALVIPVSFTVGVAGSLIMVYATPWAPMVMMGCIALAAAASSLSRLRVIRLAA